MANPAAKNRFFHFRHAVGGGFEIEGGGVDVTNDDEEVDVLHGVDGDDAGSWCSWTCR